MHKPAFSLLAVLFMIAIPASLTHAQPEVIVGDDGSDAYLRRITDAAPLLPLHAVEIELTPALEIEAISGITADAEGDIYILQRGAATPPVVVTDARGNVLRSFGRGLFTLPHSIRLDPAGNVWAVDSNTSMIFKFSPTGEKLLEINVGDVPDRDERFCAAADIAISQDGQVFVADGYCNARVVVYDATTGRLVREWGRAGTGPGEFDLVHSIAISPEGHVYVADRENGRLQWFTPEGEYLGEWRSGGRLLSVSFSGQGELYISAEPKGAEPMREGIVLKIDRRDGSVVGKLEEFGHEIEASPDGAVLPATLTGRVVVYRP